MIQVSYINYTSYITQRLKSFDLVLDDQIHVWNGSFSSLEDNDCIKFQLKQENGVNHKCLLFIQLHDKTPYELKQKLLRILREHGLEERQHDNLIATENLLDHTYDIEYSQVHQKINIAFISH